MLSRHGPCINRYGFTYMYMTELRYLLVTGCVTQTAKQIHCTHVQFSNRF